MIEWVIEMMVVVVCIAEERGHVTIERVIEMMMTTMMVVVIVIVVELTLSCIS